MARAWAHAAEDGGARGVVVLESRPAGQAADAGRRWRGAPRRPPGSGLQHQLERSRAASFNGKEPIFHGRDGRDLLARDGRWP